MKKLILILVCICMVSAVYAETVQQRYIDSYNDIQSVSCDVRKTNKAGKHKIKTLSNLYYRKPLQLHVQNFTPVERRIIADGTNFYSWIKGDPKGFSRPVDQLDEEMYIQLKKIPGTAMDHMLRVRDLPEEQLESSEAYPTRCGYENENAWVVFSFDDKDRLCQIDLYKSKDSGSPTGTYLYSDFEEVLPNVWIPMLHEVILSISGQTANETSRFSNYTVNEPIADNLFYAPPFFKDVEFVNSFDKIYPGGLK